MVADNPSEKIRLKMFHCEIQNDHAAIAKQEEAFEQIPVVAKVSALDVQENYLKIKAEIEDLLFKECKKLVEEMGMGKEVEVDKSPVTQQAQSL
jgi:hypothetical protein